MGATIYSPYNKFEGNFPALPENSKKLRLIVSRNLRKIFNDKSTVGDWSKFTMLYEQSFQPRQNMIILSLKTCYSVSSGPGLSKDGVSTKTMPETCVRLRFFINLNHMNRGLYHSLFYIRNHGYFEWPNDEFRELKTSIYSLTYIFIRIIKQIT